METREEKELIERVETVIDRDRVLNFSDAIFAFAATLLILKIDLPSIPPELIETRLGPELLNLWPSYLANLISFLVIGYYWLTHHAIFNMIRRFDQRLFWLNVIFLVFISFLPFPVDLFGDYGNSRSVVVFYCAALALAGYLLTILWIYVSHENRLINKSISRRRIQFYTLKHLVAPVVFTLSIPIAFVDLTLAKLSWLFVFLGIILLHRLYHYRQLDDIERTAV